MWSFYKDPNFNASLIYKCQDRAVCDTLTKRKTVKKNTSCHSDFSSPDLKQSSPFLSSFEVGKSLQSGGLLTQHSCFHNLPVGDTPELARQSLYSNQNQNRSAGRRVSVVGLSPFRSLEKRRFTLSHSSTCAAPLTSLPNESSTQRSSTREKETTQCAPPSFQPLVIFRPPSDPPWISTVCCTTRTTAGGL